MKKVIFILLMIIMALPLIELIAPFCKDRGLGGVQKATTYHQLSWKSWFNSEWQENTATYLNEKIGFHNSLIRLHNQIGYDLFFKFFADATAFRCKNNMICLGTYVGAYLGTDLDTAADAEYASQLAFVRDTLEKKNIKLLLVTCPSKPSVYPENLPDYLSTRTPRINYQTFISKCRAQHIPILDFAEYFIKNKQSMPYPVFAETGVHWSDYAATIALDSMIHYLEQFKQIQLPHIKYDGWEESTKPRHYENDAEDYLNLLYPIKLKRKLAYPINLHYEQTPGCRKLKAVVIGDSFFWQFYDTGIMDIVFDDAEFDYYFNTSYTTLKRKPNPINYKDCIEKLEKQELLILFDTEPYMPSVCKNFVSALYNHYHKANGLNEKSIAAKIEEIKQNPDLYNNALEKANHTNKSIDNQLWLDAIESLTH